MEIIRKGFDYLVVEPSERDFRKEVSIATVATITFLSIVWLSRHKIIPKSSRQKGLHILLASVVALVIPAFAAIAASVKGKGWVKNKVITIGPVASRIFLIIGVLTLLIQAISYLVNKFYSKSPKDDD